MANHIKVSIIVPVYNVESYLARCLDSIINQSYTNLEVILVDDCSVDHSLEICRSYANEDSRIILLHNDTNSGVSFSRNRALEIASGDYVMMIDSDDWIELNAVESLLNALIDASGDVGVCGYVKEFEKGNKEIVKIVESLTSKTSCAVLDDAMRKIAPYVGFAGGKLYRMDIIRQHDLRYDTTISICEDSLFNYCFLDVAHNCVLLDECLYHYLIRATSATRTANANKLRTKIIAFEKASLVAQKYPESVFYYRVNSTIFDAVLQYVSAVISQGVEFCESDYDEMLSKAQKALKKTRIKYVSGKLLVKYFLFRNCPNLSRKMFSSQRKQ